MPEFKTCSARRIALLLSASLAFCLAPVSRAQNQSVSTARPASREIVRPPESVPDPIEPLNRAFWGFNRGLMNGVVKPTAKVYRFLVPRPVRVGIGNVGRNVVFPGRLINHLLQGRWGGARDESYRFIYNSTVGLAGFFDLASKEGIPKSDADFGQTFGLWGWRPQFFLMLPVFGPSNDRDAVGLAADTAANPLLYISPYDFSGNNPLSYLGPYTFFSYGVKYNELSDSVEEFARFSRAEMDPYDEIQYFSGFATDIQKPDFRVAGEIDESSRDTIESVAFNYKDPEFPGRGATRSVLIPATGRKLKFTFWLRPGKAPVVYIVPGLGSHRLERTCVALAEILYNHGFSVVSVSSPFHAEFMENASTAALPGYLPVDAADLRDALAAVDRRLSRLRPDRLGSRSLMGYSMGGLETLCVAAADPTNSRPSIRFDKYVVIDTPVNLLRGISELDAFYQAPLAWPADGRSGRLKNTLLKVAALERVGVATNLPPPFDAVESKFLVGLTFRRVLRDVIFSSQRRTNLGVIRHSFSNMRREPLYREIVKYGFMDYFEKFAAPYYESKGVALPATRALEEAGDARAYEAGLKARRDIDVIVNQNDFLLGAGDLAWLRATFSGGNLTVFPRGGHLGNFSSPEVQAAILKALAP